MSSAPLHLTASLRSAGFHPAGWRLCSGAAFPIGRRFQAMAATAERGLFDAVWLHGDDAIPIDPLPLLGSLIAGTTRLGLGAQWRTARTEPFHVARVFATLDHLSGGRTAWIAELAEAPALAPQFAHADRLDGAGTLARGRELIDVARQLWDSWEDEGLLLDVPTGRFADPARVHPIGHAGPHFTVRGPLNVPRPPQGQPVLVMRADGAALPETEVLLVPAPARHGARVLLDVTPILGATEDEARRRVAELDAFGPMAGLRVVGTAEQVLDQLAALALGGGCDGFNLVPAVLPDDLDAFVDAVVPAGQSRGLFRTAYDGPTLRDHLRLPRARSRFAA